jgi:hypothetical protein
MNQYNDCSSCDDDEIDRQRCSIELFALWAYRPVHVCPPLPGNARCWGSMAKIRLMPPSIKLLVSVAFQPHHIPRPRRGALSMQTLVHDQPEPTCDYVEDNSAKPPWCRLSQRQGTRSVQVTGRAFHYFRRRGHSTRRKGSRGRLRPVDPP